MKLGVNKVKALKSEEFYCPLKKALKGFLGQALELQGFEGGHKPSKTWTEVMWVFPKIGVGPPNPWNFNRVFHYFCHPFWGTSIFGNTHVDKIHSVEFQSKVGGASDENGVEQWMDQGLFPTHKLGVLIPLKGSQDLVSSTQHPSHENINRSQTATHSLKMARPF